MVADDEAMLRQALYRMRGEMRSFRIVSARQGGNRIEGSMVSWGPVLAD